MGAQEGDLQISGSGTLGRFLSPENGYSTEGTARCTIKSSDLFMAADNYWCPVTCQKWMDRESPTEAAVFMLFTLRQ